MIGIIRNGRTEFPCGCGASIHRVTEIIQWSPCSMHANAHELFVLFMEARIEMPGDGEKRIDWLRRATALAFRILERLPRKGVQSA